MNSSRRGCLGCLGILLGMIICGSIVYISVDRVCYTGITRRIPVYPEATQIWLSHNMLFEWGMGTTVATYESDEDPETVRRFYANNQRAFTQNDATDRNPLVSAWVRLTQARFDVTEAEDGTGSQIILYGVCAN